MGLLSDKSEIIHMGMLRAGLPCRAGFGAGLLIFLGMIGSFIAASVCRGDYYPDGVNFYSDEPAYLSADNFYLYDDNYYYQIDYTGTVIGFGLFDGANVTNYVDGTSIASDLRLLTGGNATLNTLTISADATFADNLSIGPTLSFGEAFLNYQDNGDYTSSNVTFLGNDAQVNWVWQTNPADGSLTQMMLDGGGNLTLQGAYYPMIRPGDGTLADIPLAYLADVNYATPFSESGMISLDGGNIILDGSDPTAPSLTLGWIAFNGTSGGLKVARPGYSGNFVFDPGNQTLSFSSGLSLAGSDTGMTIQLTGIGMALGSNTTVSGAGAIAIGNDSDVAGLGALAFGGGNASGNFAVALGNNSMASGTNALAWAGGNATGAGAVAMGANATATATGAMALGSETVAETWGTVALGRFNAAIAGNATAWSSSAPAFVVGVGNSTASANGLVITNGGNHTVNGNLTLTNPDYISPSDASQPVELEVQGAAVFNGTVTINGNVTMSQRHGDISMGQFVD